MKLISRKEVEWGVIEAIRPLRRFWLLPNGTIVGHKGSIYIKRSFCDVEMPMCRGMFWFIWPLTKVRVLEQVDLQVSK